jgi:hypothetical protein
MLPLRWPARDHERRKEAASKENHLGVTFGRGYDVCIVGIDGTWRRDCLRKTVSDNDAVLTVEGFRPGSQPEGILSPVVLHGFAYRRCELVRVNGRPGRARTRRARTRRAVRPTRFSPIVGSAVIPMAMISLRKRWNEIAEAA